MIAHLPTPAEKSGYVQDLFGRIAGVYDLLNHVLSLGVDILWRRSTARALDLGRARNVLDVCCGTGDLTLEMSRHVGPETRVVGVDFCAPMLARAAVKSTAPRPGVALALAQGDGLALPFRTASFDRVAVAFGVRNMADLDLGLAELARMLEPGGLLGILEFSQPRWAPIRALYLGYFRHVLPRIGQMVSGESDPYRYLPESVLAFPEREALVERLQKVGFRDVSWTDLTLGIATLYVARRAD